MLDNGRDGLLLSVTSVNVPSEEHGDLNAMNIISTWMSVMDYTLQDFEPHIGSGFRLVSNGSPDLDLTLVEVEDQTIPGQDRDPSIRSQPFSLIFHGPLSPVAAQAAYRVEHSQLGAMTIFLVPIGPDRKGQRKMQYQAIFN